MTHDLGTLLQMTVFCTVHKILQQAFAGLRLLFFLSFAHQSACLVMPTCTVHTVSTVLLGKTQVFSSHTAYSSSSDITGQRPILVIQLLQLFIQHVQPQIYNLVQYTCTVHLGAGQVTSLGVITAHCCMTIRQSFSCDEQAFWQLSS